MRGNGNKWLLTVTCLLFVSNIGTVIYGYALYKTTVKLAGSELIIYLYGFGAFLEASFFGVSHWMLAVKYNRLSRVVPVMIEGKEIEPDSKRRVISNWFLLGLNFLVPLIRGISACAYRMRRFHQK